MASAASSTARRSACRAATWRESEDTDLPNEADDVLSALLAARGIN